MKQTISVIVFVAGPALAGPGANLYGCIQINASTFKGHKVFFEPSPISQDMTNTGNTGSADIASAGLTCASVGYVEAIRGFNPWDSHWTLSYRLMKPLRQGQTEDQREATGHSGSIKTTWYMQGLYKGNVVVLSPRDGNKVAVCNIQTNCTETEVEWPGGTQGPLYIVFKPGI